MASNQPISTFRGGRLTAALPLAGGPGKTLDEPRLLAFFFPFPGDPPRVIQAVAPWGLIVPGEALESLDAFYLMEIDGHRVPFGSTVLIRFMPEDGIGAQEVRVPFFGPDLVVQVMLPDAWFAPAVGKHVTIDYSVQWPDGVRYPGPGIEIYVKPMLQLGSFSLEGIPAGESIAPDAHPDGIVATFEHVPNLDSYNNPRFRWAVNGERNGFITTLATFDFEIEGLEATDAQVTLPPETYQGFYDLGYINIYAVALLIVEMMPLPNPSFELIFSYGRYPVLPPGQ
ncbi:hypothetical protein PIN31009_00699 [Pandoraea iniqua]|uniref:hypothetical protein n=1 Tax=Pandoraea iniqua TaxID=2508288 RepID=UPI001242A852|nr:hypothetical protein [Pandoraea iniqua]VVD72740.1 hypothetical protein PIN31009_00699 [Pandoraea iniqua]